MPFYRCFFLYSFSGLLFFEIFSVCAPLPQVIKRQEGASILCLAGRCEAVVSDFFYLFISATLCHKEETGNIGARSSSEEEGAVPSAMLHYTFAILLPERRKSRMFSLIRHSREEDLGTD